MMQDFVGPMRAEINRAIYVWGRVGEVVQSAAWIRSHETSTANADRAIAKWEERKAAGVDPVDAYDCSGFIVCQLRRLGISQIRYTADMLSNICPTIPKADLRVGDFVFCLDDKGNAFHVGVVSKIVSGITYIVESRGRAYGVVERPISAGTWDDYSHNPFIDTSIQEVSDILQKGDKSTPVKSWQEALNKLGATLATDGSFGPATELATKAFQTRYGLPATGIVEVATAAKAWDALGVILSDTAELNTVKAQLSAKSAQLISLTAETVAAKAAQLAAEQFAALKEQEGKTALADLHNIALGLRSAAKY